MSRKVGLLGAATLFATISFINTEGTHAPSAHVARPLDEAWPEPAPASGRASSASLARTAGVTQSPLRGTGSRAGSFGSYESAGGVERKAPSPNQDSVTVRGNWANDGVVCPGEPGPLTDDPIVFTIHCKGTSLWGGAFTGRTLVEVEGTYDTNGNLKGTFEDWFYGTYLGDDTTGGLHIAGTVVIDGKTQGFIAEGTILGGTCGFAGSSGTMTFVGNTFNGGYTGQWIRPKKPATTDPTCNPLGAIPGS